MKMRPNQKYGTVPRKVVTGTRASSALPRLQPITAPTLVPIAKEITVATPTRPRVQGRAEAIASLTGAMPVEIETPRSPRSSIPQ
jgi:hypothetical protein